METYQDLEYEAMRKKMRAKGLSSITLWMTEESLIEFERWLREMGIEFIEEVKPDSDTTDCNTEA